MELNDALRRILGQHARLVGVCLAAGLVFGFLLAPHGKEYAASARLVLDTPDPVARQQSEAIADTGKAIATSPSQVSRALHAAGIKREDPALFAKEHVSLRALGSSGVLELTVSDRSKRAAAAVANALASLVIRTRLGVTEGETTAAFADLDERTAELNKEIAAADQRVNALTLRIDSAGTPTAANTLRARRDASEKSRDYLVQQRSVLSAERASLLTANAQRPRPAIISAATPPVQAASNHRLLYLVLGAVLGLILGMGAAGAIETARPTVVGGDTLADELDAALLGTFSGDAEAARAAHVGARLRLAAEAAQVGNVALIGAGPGIDLENLARSLSVAATASPANTNGNPRSGRNGHGRVLTIAPFSPQTPPINNGTRSGLVLVSPTTLKKSELTDIVHLLRLSQLPLLGVIAYGSASTLPRRITGKGNRLGVKDKVNLLVRAIAK